MISVFLSFNVNIPWPTHRPEPSGGCGFSPRHTKPPWRSRWKCHRWCRQECLLHSAPSGCQLESNPCGKTAVDKPHGDWKITWKYLNQLFEYSMVPKQVVKANKTFSVSQDSWVSPVKIIIKWFSAVILSTCLCCCQCCVWKHVFSHLHFTNHDVQGHVISSLWMEIQHYLGRRKQIFLNK